MLFIYFCELCFCADAAVFATALPARASAEVFLYGKRKIRTVGDDDDVSVSLSALPFFY